MNNTDTMPPIETTSDEALVAACLDGDRDAFGLIVERYQRLLCSLAYSATGCLSESEDIAQEAFLTAWQKLADLREPAKLRSWLCGILRNKLGRLYRAESRQPASGAESLDDAAAEIPSSEEATEDMTINKEEQAIMWHALAQLPERYREPLVLYYREHRSVEHVAVDLDLTEDAVKQRLSRGRKMLQERVLRFVEGALTRSTPGRVFTAGVLASIATISPPAKAAVAGGVATHAAAAAKSAGLAAFLASISGAVSTVLALRAGLDQSRTGRERRAVVKSAAFAFGSFVMLVGVLFALRAAALRWPQDQEIYATVSQVVVVGFTIGWPVVLMRLLRNGRELRTAERKRSPESFRHPADRPGSRAGEYKSRARLFGIPLVHIRFSTPDRDAPPVVGWIAGGDRAYGILFAWGAFAVGSISVGAVSVGIVTLGAVGFGLVGLGSIGVGFLGIGAIAIGVKAYASLSALGWETAQSYGFGIARTAAEAPIALAEHANDPVARELLANPHFDTHLLIFLFVSTFFTIVPVALYAAAVRKRMTRGRSNHQDGEHGA